MEAVHQPERILRLEEVTARTGLKRSAIYTRVAAGTFPKPFPIDTRKDGRASVIGFAESEIDGWIRAKIAARGDPQMA
jgi:prophage regulatory protein